MITDHRRLSSLSYTLYLLPLAWLWFRLIDHLRVEWSLNSQYAYGWAVPFLCLYLIWHSARRKAQGEEHQSKCGDQGIDTSPQPSPRSRWRGEALCVWPLAVCALLFLPTRLIQEANPEWRLVSWALALEVIGLTLVSIRLALGAGRLAQFAFAICFFLVAVPWPTFVEASLIQGLMRANIAATTELLGVIGVPAVQHGNVIEIATGRVGIDDACSGIRSLQATLMLSLLFGEVYALSARRRGLCVLAGFALAFLFNVGRTLLLTWVAAAKGVGAVASWHDPAGVTILVGCFLSLWGLAVLLSRQAQDVPRESAVRSQGSEVIGVAVRSSGAFSVSAFQRFSVFLTAWLFLAEIGTELWYRSHEWRLPAAIAWKVAVPEANAAIAEVPLPQREARALRSDEALNFKWQPPDHTRWQLIFLRWNAGRSAGYLARGHTPDVCLTASGRELVAQWPPHLVHVHGLELPFSSYVFKGEDGPLHVFYCLWADHPATQLLRNDLGYASRLAPVLAGRRNSGQRSLEVAIWGMADHQEAEAALARELDKLIKVEK